jgi:colanic acid biosynthesis glycosyl transferase WcaI
MIGIFYAPEPTGIGPYMTGLAEMIGTFADVEVFTGVPHYPTWEVQAGYRWRFRFRERRGGVDVRRFLHFVPRRQSAIKRALLESSFVINTVLSRPLRRPDVVIASTPSLGAAVVAARFAKRYRVPYGLVVQDLVGQGAGQSGIAGGAAVANIVGRVEARAFREAAIVAVVTDSFRQQLAAYGVDESKVRLLPNWSHIASATSDRATFRRTMGWDDTTFVVLHTGNMGLKQDLGNVIEAARALSARTDIRIVLGGDGSQRPTLTKQAKGLSNLEFLDTVPDDDYANLLHASDLLLVNERSSVGDMALPSKLTSYFASGRAVLAAVGSDGACAREIDKTQGAARVVEPGNPAALAQAIEELALDVEATTAMAAAGARYSQDHLSRAAAERRAHTLVEELLAYHRDAPSAGSA